MPVVSVINYKGGVGKTSLTANIAAELAFRGKDVLLIDMDPQASLTFSFVKPDVWEKDLAPSKTIKAWYDTLSGGPDVPLSKLIHKPTTVRQNLNQQAGELDLIPSHLGLINVDLELATRLGGATLQQAKRNYLSVHRRLAEGLASLDPGSYDLVLIDCPPNFNVVTKTAIVASDSIVIPARPDYLSTLGIDYLRRSLTALVRDFNEFVDHASVGDVERIDPEILGVVFTMVQYYNGRPISALRPFIAQTQSLKIPVFDSQVRENKTLFADAAESGVPVVLVGHSNPTYAQVVTELEALTGEFATKAGM